MGKLSVVIANLEFSRKELGDSEDDKRNLYGENAALDVLGLSAEVKQGHEEALDRADYTEDQSRRNNLRISGIPEARTRTGRSLGFFANIST